MSHTRPGSRDSSAAAAVDAVIAARKRRGNFMNGLAPPE
jgi:hypothetical protein